MTISEELKTRLTSALIDGDAEVAEAAVVEALDAGADPLALINDVMIPALTVVGNQFQNGEVFLPELMLAGDAAQQVSKHVEAAIAAQGKTSEPKGVVVIGTVQGDIHDIGKNIVVTMLKAHGFRVVDLGRNVTSSSFLTAAVENNAGVVAMSSLMTTTRPMIENTINLFGEVGQRANYKMIVGGGCVTEDWASTIGADGYSADAVGAVELCKQFSA
jgi:methylmalonyl-CoA mutase cobalamin-binding domain/chain